jgi:hypothetical protein
MKNIILLVFLSFVALSCSKDENNEPKVNFPEHLIGKWKMIACTENSDTDDNTFPCNIQVTKNTYDIWFKADGTYISKTHFACEKSCQYLLEEVVIDSNTTGFVITFNPDVDCNEPCFNWASSLDINKNELIFLYSGIASTNVTYKRVE